MFARGASIVALMVDKGSSGNLFFAHSAALPIGQETPSIKK